MCYDVPTSSYFSRELLAAAIRTELPDDMVFEAIPFPFDALIFMLPKGAVPHPTEVARFFLLFRRELPRTNSVPGDPALDFGLTAELRSWSSAVDRCVALR